jgi:predicted HicB family RNase H-like nuclease
MEYKGYVGKVVFDEDAGVLHGEVLNTRDVITFQGRSVRELQKAFRESIDDYLQFCAERSEDPEKPFSGKFSVRLSPELHRRAYTRARQMNKSLNAWISEMVEREADRS